MILNKQFNFDGSRKYSDDQNLGKCMHKTKKIWIMPHIVEFKVANHVHASTGAGSDAGTSPFDGS